MIQTKKINYSAPTVKVVKFVVESGYDLTGARTSGYEGSEDFAINDAEQSGSGDGTSRYLSNRWE